MSKSTYQKSFKKFISSTNEKEVIARQIQKNIDLSQISSVLDIGAGQGDLLDEIKKRNPDISPLCVEGNGNFIPALQKKGYEYINKIWEDVEIDKYFDLIIAAYVTTYFSPKDMKDMIEKMVGRLNKNGHLFIVTVDASKGSWRKVHEDFYSMIGFEKKSSTILVEGVIEEYNPQKIEFTTTISTQNMEDMIDILEFDFYKFGDDFYKNKDKISDIISCYSRGEGVELDVANKAFLLTR